MLTLVAPVLDKTILPDFAPFKAEALIRTETVPLAEPPLFVMVAVLPKVAPSLATSKSVGAVTVIFAVRFVPVTVKDCAGDGAPAVVRKLVRVPEVETTGVDKEIVVSATVRSSIRQLAVPALAVPAPPKP